MTGTDDRNARGRVPCRHCGTGPVSRPRGLCWVCYYTPGVKEQYPSTSKYARRSGGTEADHRVMCRLELLSGMLHGETGWTADEWAAVLAVLPARYARVVVLHTLHGLTWEAICERLGVERGRPQAVFKAACRKLAAARPRLAAELVGGGPGSGSATCSRRGGVTCRL